MKVCGVVEIFQKFNHFELWIKSDDEMLSLQKFIYKSNAAGIYFQITVTKVTALTRRMGCFATDRIHRGANVKCFQHRSESVVKQVVRQESFL